MFPDHIITTLKEFPLDCTLKKSIHFIEMLPTMAALVTKKGKIIHCNQHVCHKLGYSLEEFKNTKVQTFSSRIKKVTIPDELIIKFDIYRQQIQVKCKKGIVITLKINCSMVKIENNEYILATAEDISNEIKSNKRLKKSEKKYRNLFENMLNSYAYHKILLDDRGVPYDYQFIEVNKEFERSTQKMRNTVIGKTVTQVFPDLKQDRVDWIAIYGKVALTGEQTWFEVYSTLFDKWYSVCVYSPKKYYFATVFEDITKRKLAEQAMIRSERLLNEAQKLAQIAGWETNLITNKSFFTTQVYKLLNIDPQQPLTLNQFLQYYEPKSRKALIQAIEKTKQTGEPYRIESKIITSTNEDKWVMSIGRAIHQDNQPVKIWGTLQDITVKKNAELAIKQVSAKIIQAQENEKKYISSEIHDSIGQMLPVLKMELQMIKDLKNIDQVAGHISSSVKLLNTIIDQTRNLADTLRPDILDKFGLRSAIVNFTDKMSKQYGLDIKLNIYEKMDISPGTEIEIYRIIQEGITNIIKHANATKVSITIKTQDEGYQIRINDNGIGFQQSQKKKNKYQSLGLKIMQERAQLIDGTIQYESDKTGTSIIVWIPKSKGAI